MRALEKIAFDAYAHRFGNVQLPEFIRVVRAFDQVPIEVNGHVVGVVLFRGNELHTGVIPEYRGHVNWRSVMRNIVSPVLKRYGYVWTAVLNDNDAGIKFVERLGFESIGQYEEMTVYKLTRMNHA